MRYAKRNAVFILLFSFSFAFSQVSNLGSLKDLESINTLRNHNGGQTIDVNNVKGSPYLEEDFKKGMLIREGEEIVLYIRFNVYSDNFEVKNNSSDKKITVLPRSNTFKIQLGGRKYIFTQSNYVFNETGSGYLAMISEPNAKFTLYKEFFSDYTPKKEGATPYDMAKPAMIETEYKYFLKDNESEKFIELEDHKKRILDAFPKGLQNQIKSFMKVNDLNLRGKDLEIEAELLKIIDFSNTI